MEVNIKKCHVITFDRKLNPIAHSYTIGSSALDRTFSIRDLGVTLDRKMTFNEHITAVTAKAFATLGFIRRNTSAFKDVHVLKTLYCSLVRSLLEYAAQVWSPYHNIQIRRLEKVQRAFIRYALRILPWRDPPESTSIEDRRRLIGLETLIDRRHKLQKLFIFDLLTNQADCQFLLQRLCFHVPSRRLRQAPPLIRIAGHDTAYGHNEPFDTCCRLFNSVSDVFEFGMSKHSFKKYI